jgi:hypothetical protein
MDRCIVPGDRLALRHLPFLHDRFAAGGGAEA